MVSGLLPHREFHSKIPQVKPKRSRQSSAEWPGQPDSQLWRVKRKESSIKPRAVWHQALVVKTGNRTILRLVGFVLLTKHILKHKLSSVLGSRRNVSNCKTSDFSSWRLNELQQLWMNLIHHTTCWGDVEISTSYQSSAQQLYPKTTERTTHSLLQVWQVRTGRRDWSVVNNYTFSTRTIWNGGLEEKTDIKVKSCSSQ